MHYGKNEDVVALHGINDHIFAHGKTSGAESKLVVARAAKVGMPGKEEKLVGDGIDQAVGDIQAATFIRHVKPNVVEIRIYFA